MNSKSHPQAAFERVTAGHRELKELLARIERALEHRSASIAEVGDLLGQLGDRLIRHFMEEEDGGYFTEALVHAPQLVNRANELLAQHPKMSTAAKQLVVEIKTPQDAERWWQETCRRFQAFEEELLKHERAEDRLLQEAYTHDLGSHD